VPNPKDPKNLYIKSEEPISLRQLAKLYKGKKGCSLTTLETRCNKENWPKLRSEFWGEVEAKTRQKEIEKKSDLLAASLADLNQKHQAEYEEIRSLLNAGFEHYRKLWFGTEIERKEARKNKSLYPSFKDLTRLRVLLAQAERLAHNYNPKGVQQVDTGAGKRSETFKSFFKDLGLKELSDYEPS
jgi:hypothetical protein